MTIKIIKEMLELGYTTKEIKQVLKIMHLFKKEKEQDKGVELC